MENKAEKIKMAREEVKKAIVGKEEVIDKVMMAILSGGHVLLDDIPGVGKTTLALAFSKALGLLFNRIQFTPDVVPSDVTGFYMYNKDTGKFEYNKGAAMCNFFLADEINRTSSKTQSALLEVMQEGSITVDGNKHEVPKPFVVMATQNPVGTAGTQMLPEAQVDRFMIQLSMGYPTVDEQVIILDDRESEDPLDNIKAVVSNEELNQLKDEVDKIFIDTKIKKYIAEIIENSRHHDLVKLGLSPRSAIALMKMAKANAFINERDYVVPDDVKAIFFDVARHRIILNSKSLMSNLSKEDILKEILEGTEEPTVYEKRKK